MLRIPRPYFCAVFAAVLLWVPCSQGKQDAATGRTVGGGVIADSAVDDDQDRARLLGLLTYRIVNVEFDRTPARQALDEIKRQASLPLIVRWNTDAMAMGIDPDALISLSETGESARTVLEALLAQCGKPATDEECTWQIRRGYIEVGTKRRLAVPAARSMRLYDVSDLLIEAPDFDGGDSRKTPLALAVELVERVCETVEPGHWDFGQAPPPAQDDEDRLIKKPESPAPSQPHENSAPATPSAPSPATPAAPDANNIAAPVSPNDRWNWASIRVWRDRLLVVAPDFMHRQIGGYPAPIAPDDAAATDDSSAPSHDLKSRGKERQP